MTLSYFANELYSPELVQDIDDHILLYNIDSFSLLDFDSQKQLASIAMKNMGKSAYECIVENKSFDEVVQKIIFSLETYNRSTDIFLVDTIHKGIVVYLEDALNEIFDQRKEEILSTKREEAGLRPYQHKDNGEISWSHA